MDIEEIEKITQGPNAKKKMGRPKKPDPDLDIPEDWVPLLIWPKFFYGQQTDFLLSESWLTFMLSGNGAGKTQVLVYSLVAQMLGIHPKQLAKPPIKVKVLVSSFDFVTDVILEKMFTSQRIMPNGYTVGPLMPQSMIKKNYSREHKAISIKNGSLCSFSTCEQGAMSQRGTQFDVFVVDEEPENERVYDELLRGLRNAKGGGRIYFAMTPPYAPGRGPGWTKEKIIDREHEDDNIKIVRSVMADNPAITQEFIERFSAGKTKEQIDVQLYGKYPTWGDLVYPNFSNTYWDPEKGTGNLLPYAFNLPNYGDADWVMAFDWHASKECAAVWGFIDNDGNVIIFDELNPNIAKNKTITDLADIFRNIEGANERWRRWQDPSAKNTYSAMIRGFNAWDEFRNNGIATCAGKNRDPEVGISIMNGYLAGDAKNSPKLFITENCTHIRRSMENHYWKRGTDGVGRPDGRWSDFPICIRYILQEIGSKKNKRNHKKWPLHSYDRAPLEGYGGTVTSWF